MSWRASFSDSTSKSNPSRKKNQVDWSKIADFTTVRRFRGTRTPFYGPVRRRKGGREEKEWWKRVISVDFTSQPTLGLRWLQWVGDAVHVVSPRAALSVLAVAGLAVFPVSVEVVGRSTPAAVLDSEDQHTPFSGDLVALGDGVSSSAVVASDSRVGTVHLRYSAVAGVLPASQMGVF